MVQLGAVVDSVLGQGTVDNTLRSLYGIIRFIRPCLSWIRTCSIPKNIKIRVHARDLWQTSVWFHLYYSDNEMSANFSQGLISCRPIYISPIGAKRVAFWHLHGKECTYVAFIHLVQDIQESTGRFSQLRRGCMWCSFGSDVDNERIKACWRCLISLYSRTCWRTDKQKSWL